VLSTRVILFLAHNSLVKMDMWDCALWCKSQSFRCQSSGRSHHTFSNSRREKSQYYEELTVWPARTESLWTISLISKKIMNILLTLLLSVSMSLNFPCTAHAFFPEGLCNHCQGLPPTFSQICTMFDAVRFSDPLRNHIWSMF
jgi:hypothetical protein